MATRTRDHRLSRLDLGSADDEAPLGAVLVFVAMVVAAVLAAVLL